MRLPQEQPLHLLRRGLLNPWRKPARLKKQICCHRNQRRAAALYGFARVSVTILIRITANYHSARRLYSTLSALFFFIALFQCFIRPNFQIDSEAYHAVISNGFGVVPGSVIFDGMRLTRGMAAFSCFGRSPVRQFMLKLFNITVGMI